MSKFSKEDLQKKGIKDTALGVQKSGNKYKVPKKLQKTASSIQKVRDLETSKKESVEITDKLKSIIEGAIKKANKAKKNLALTGVKPGEKPSGPPSKDVHGNPMISSRQAAHMAKRGVKKTMNHESLQKFGDMLYEGLVKKANKAKKNSFEIKKGGISGNPGDEALSKASYRGNNGAEHPTHPTVGHKSDRNHRKVAHKFSRGVPTKGAGDDKTSRYKGKTMESYTNLRFKSILLETFAKQYITEERKLGAFKRSEIKKGLNSEPGEEGAGDRYIKAAAAKRSKENAKDKRSSASGEYDSITSKHGLEPKHPGKAVPRGALRKAVMGSAGAAKGPAKEPTKPAEKSHYKQGATQKPLTKDQINGMGVGGKSGEAASHAKYDKIEKIASTNPQADRRKALAKKLAGMRKPA